MNYRNEFDDPPRSGFLAGIGPKAAFFIVLIALSFMIGVVWKLYSGAGNNNPSNVPIVRADSDPFKIVPEDPGGMEIRHKDSTLFSAIKKEREEEGGRIENLLADDENEEPMPRSQLFAGLNTSSDPDIARDDAPTPLDQPVTADQKMMTENQAEAVEEMVEETNESVIPPVPSSDETVRVIEIEDAKTLEIAPKAPAKVEPKAEVAEVKVETKPEPKVQPKAETKPKPKPESKPKPTSKPKNIPAPAPVEIRTPSMPVVSKDKPSGEYYIQLASTKDKSSAAAEWKKLSKKYSIISDLAYRVETADLGSKGVYYRIQAGPVSKSEATSKCAAIKKINPNGCLVKK